jgi:hypothetical protein
MAIKTPIEAEAIEALKALAHEWHKDQRRHDLAYGVCEWVKVIESYSIVRAEVQRRKSLPTTQTTS